MFHHDVRKLARAVLIGGVGLSAVAMSAQAGSINWAFGETTSIEASGPTAVGSANASYTSVDQGGGYFDVPAGINSTLTDPTSSLTYSPNIAPPGLSSAALFLSADSSAMNVSASLAAGATHMYASSVEDTTGCCAETLDAASVEMKDLLTFTVGGTGSETITVGLSLDGSLDAGSSTGASYSQFIEYNFGAPFMYWNAGTAFSPATSPTTGWDTFNFANVSISGFNFTGTFTITNGEVVPISFIQQMNCNLGETCDFSNTTQLSLILPSDVTYTSDSGVFLTQQLAPEPDSVILFGLGIAAMACILHRRSKLLAN